MGSLISIWQFLFLSVMITRYKGMKIRDLALLGQRELRSL